MRLRTGKREQRRDLHGIAPRALGALAAPITPVSTTTGGHSLLHVSPVPHERLFQVFQQIFYNYSVRRPDLTRTKRRKKMGLEEDFKAAADLAASGANDGLKKISQDQQLKLYGWFKQVERGRHTSGFQRQHALPTAHPPGTHAARTHASTHARRRHIHACARCRNLASAAVPLVCAGKLWRLQYGQARDVGLFRQGQVGSMGRSERCEKFWV
jgi:hypothetical protein